jgi:hypothetical protein
MGEGLEHSFSCGITSGFGLSIRSESSILAMDAMLDSPDSLVLHPLPHEMWNNNHPPSIHVSQNTLFILL